MEYGGHAAPMAAPGRGTGVRVQPYMPAIAPRPPPALLILAVFLSPGPTITRMRHSLPLFRDVDCEWRLYKFRILAVYC
jgi:hypothetical protein